MSGFGTKAMKLIIAFSLGLLIRLIFLSLSKFTKKCYTLNTIEVVNTLEELGYGLVLYLFSSINSIAKEV